MARAMSALIAAAFAAASVAAPAGAEPRGVSGLLGWVEVATVGVPGVSLEAKLDSGARTAALHARILRGPGEERSDALRVDDVDLDSGPRFAPSIVFAVADASGAETVFERKITRWARIKRRGGGVHIRPVVNMEFCIGGVPMRGEVSLTDRSNFNYPILVGRTMLVDAGVVIDPSTQFIGGACGKDARRSLRG